MLEDDVPKEDIGEMLADFDLDGDGNIHFEGQSSGAEPGFSFFLGGGGARKRLCARTHITSAGPNSLNSRVVLMLSRAIWALFFKHSDKKLESIQF